MLVLLIKNRNGSWGFPKGRVDEGEINGTEIALRELKEETGIDDCELDLNHTFIEKYRKPAAGVYVDKEITYYLGFVTKNDIVIQQEEIEDYKWASFAEAESTLTYSNRKAVLQQVIELLT